MIKHSPYIIAEIGFNHEGDMDLAYDMIHAAAVAGADAVKFQTFEAKDLALPSSPHYALIEPAQMTFDQMKQLKTWTDQARIDFLSTPFSARALSWLVKLDAPAVKIASMDCTNTHLLKKVAETGKTIFLSTGMASLEEIDKTLDFLAGKKSGEVVLLHCISNYPADQAELNLSVISLLAQMFSIRTGYSDHHNDPMACLLASVMGATVIETHFTLTPQRTDGDHIHSMGPEMLKKLIKDIDTAQTMIGSQNALCKRSDRDNAPVLRRGVYLAESMAKGTQIREQDLLFCRPVSELAPSDAAWIVGSTLKRDLGRHAALSKNDLAADEAEACQH